MENTKLTTEFIFDLEGEIAKIESASANPANPEKSEQTNSQDSLNSQTLLSINSIPQESNSHDSQLSHESTSKNTFSDPHDSQRYSEIWHFLTDGERELWQRAYDVAIGPNNRMSHDDASKKATNWLVDSINSKKKDDIKENFARDGYLKIFSTRFDLPIYICRDSIVAKKVPESDIKVFTFRELKALDGLNDEEAAQLIEAKLLFNGRLIKPKDM